MAIPHVALSKTMAHALRHRPWLYELELDDEGWVCVGELLEALREHYEQWADIDDEDIKETVRRSSKQGMTVAGLRQVVIT